MAYSDNQISASQLRKISHNNLTPFTLNLARTGCKTEFFRCSKILRCLPGQRLSCVGNWQGDTVFAKFFIDEKRAKVHWQREERGNRALAEKNIKTPKLIFSGAFQADRVYYCVFGYLTGSRSFKDVLYGNGDNRHSEYLKFFAKLLAQHHEAGITQQDLHLDNFLWLDGYICTLDGAEIKAQSKPIEQWASLRNLSLFFAQFLPEHDSHIPDFLSWYSSARSWTLTNTILVSTRRLTNKFRLIRQKKFLNKIQRDCSEFSCIQDWNRRTICRREFLSEKMDHLLTDPDAFINNGDLIKDGASSTVASLTLDGRMIVIKRYNIKNWKHALNRALRRTRAEVSWTNAYRLRFYGIETPKPIALVEKRWGPIRKTAYFISEYQPGITCRDLFLNAQINAPNKQLSARNVVALFNKLFKAKISHGDLKATNLLISEKSVSLIDLDVMKQHRLNFIFLKAWKKDISRFYDNWSHSDRLTNLFKHEFHAHFKIHGRRS